MPTRLVCKACDVLITDDLNVPCWVCDGPMVSVFASPTTAPPPETYAWLSALAEGLTP